MGKRSFRDVPRALLILTLAYAFEPLRTGAEDCVTVSLEFTAYADHRLHRTLTNTAMVAAASEFTVYTDHRQHHVLTNTAMVASASEFTVYTDHRLHHVLTNTAIVAAASEFSVYTDHRLHHVLTNSAMVAATSEFTVYTDHRLHRELTNTTMLAVAQEFSTFGDTTGVHWVRSPTVALTEDPAGSGLWRGFDTASLSQAEDEQVVWRRFFAVAGDRVAIAADPTSGDIVPQVGLHREGHLTNDVGNVRGGPEDGAYISHYVVPYDGPYFVAVERAAGVSGDYDLRIEVARGIDLESDTDYANGTVATTNVLALTPDGMARVGTVAGTVMADEGTTTDADAFGLGIVSNGESILLSVRLPSDSALAARVEVLDGAGAPVAGTTNPVAWVERVNITADGEYFAVVRADGGAGPRAQYVLDAAVLPTLSLDTADLAVAGLSAPTNALSGGNILVDWVVGNYGAVSTAERQWVDRLVLSGDNRYGGDDVTIGVFAHTNTLTVGNTYTQSVSVPLPLEAEGVYHLLVKTDATNGVPEMFEGNNLSRTDVMLTVALTPCADLAASDVEPSIAVGIAGDPLSVSWSVTNAGAGVTSDGRPGGDVGAWDDRLALSVNAVYGDGDDIPLGIAPHSGALSTNEGYVGGWNGVLPGGLEGDYRVLVRTDNGDEVYERGAHANNIAVSAGTLAIAPRPFADLAPTTSTAPATSGAGLPITVAWCVTNTANAWHPTPTNAWWDAVILSSDTVVGDADDRVLGTVAHRGQVAVAGGYTQQVAVTLPVDVVGAMHLFVRVDASNQVYEFQYEGNNVSTGMPITIRRPDLVVESLLVTPSTALYGAVLEATWNVRNGADAHARAGWVDSLYLSRDTQWDGGDRYLGRYPVSGALGPLEPAGWTGDTYSVTGAVHLPLVHGLEEGTHYLVVRVDSSGFLSESNENNNAAVSGPLDLSLPPSPDLVVTNVVVPVGGRAGEPIAVGWTVSNAGDFAAEGVWLDSVYLSDDDQIGSDRYIGQAANPSSLAAGATYTVTNSFHVPASATGDQWVVVLTDSGGAIMELMPGTEQNNASLGGPASIDPALYDVCVVTNPPNAGTVSGAGRYVDRTVVTLDATANTNVLPYSFLNWTEGGAFRSGSSSYAFTLTRDRTFTANFVLPQFTIAVMKRPAAGGSVSGAGTFEYGTTRVLQAFANPGYGFGSWREGSNVLGTALSLTNVVTADRTFEAVFTELNPYHDVTTATAPTNIAVVTGAGHHTNGASAVFSSPSVVTNGPNRYSFIRFVMNGAPFSQVTPYTNIFSTLQPTNMHVVAEYTSQPLEPRIASVIRSHNDPVPATTNFALAFVFDRSMDTGIEPLVVLTNPAAGIGLAPTTGAWSTSSVSDDRYSLPPITFSSGMDGAYTVLVSRATDLMGEGMGVTNTLTLEVNSTPPTNPVVRVVGTNVSSVALSWTNYVAPTDISGFRLYRETSPFTTVAAIAPVGFVGGATRTHTLGSLALDSQYYLGVAALDVAGNSLTSVTGIPVRIDSVLPPPVTVAVIEQSFDSVQVTWLGYDTSRLFGFSGFRLYWEQSSFSSVAGLTSYATLSMGARSCSFAGLDRRHDHYFAVVGYNRLDECDPNVTPGSWSDPYAGIIDEDLSIGGGDVREITIYQDMIITNGATVTIQPGVTLRFATNTGIVVHDAVLIAEGTALDPITLTSIEDAPGGSPDVGDWNGVTLTSGAGASSLRHLWIKYGGGLVIDGCSPAGTALSALFNAPAGLSLLNGATLSTYDTLVQYNRVGVMQSDTAQLAVTNAIVINNDTNAHVTGGVLNAPHNWWGATNATDIEAGLSGGVTYAPPLMTEPLLTPAVDTIDGRYSVGVPTVELEFACRIAESVRISEDSTFGDVFFTDFVPRQTFMLSEGGGLKTLYVQYRNVTGQTNAPLQFPITYVTGGPVIQTFNLTEGQALERPYGVEATATTPLGVADMEFHVDGVLAYSVNGGTLSCRWDIRSLTSGVHRVKLLARDTRGDFSTTEANVRIAQTPPPAPSITTPTNGHLTAASSVVVEGTAEPLVGVRLTRNGTVVAATNASDGGTFAFASVPLVEGDNSLVAVAFDDLGTAASASRTVERDTGSPAPVSLSLGAFSPGDGQVLSWAYQTTGERPSSYRVHWHTASFTNPAGASGSGDLLYVTKDTLTFASDGHYYYGVVGYDGAGNASELSNIVDARYDTTAPGFTVGYDKSSPVGVGPLRIVLSATEDLSGIPDLVIRFAGSPYPTMVSLSGTAPRTFEGTLNIGSATPSGVAEVRASASDLYGNVFNGVPGAMALDIDTRAPFGSIQTDALPPVQTMSNVTVLVSLTLTEAPKAGTVPTLVFDPPAGATTPVTLAGSGLNWSGSLELHPLMGSGYGVFDLSVRDALDNVGTLITRGKTLEIYNTAFPSAPGVPSLLRPASQTGGVIRLVWYPVDKTEIYRLYRTPGTNGIPGVVVEDTITTNALSDIPPTDGFYRYAVSASRRGAESGLSTVYTAYSDRTPPPAPTNVTVQLLATGTQISWERATPGEAPFKYNVYRNEKLICSSHTVTPVVDYPPKGTSVYVVASADWLGNEALSDPAAFVMLVPAVTSFTVLMQENQAPQLSWASGNPGIVGYNLYRNGARLNGALLTTTSAIDAKYAGSAKVEYAIRSVNAGGQEGPARVAEVYRLGYGLAVNSSDDGLPVRSYFDAYAVSVSNLTVTGEFALDEIELRRTVPGEDAVTVTAEASTNVVAGATTTQSVVMASATTTGEQSVRLRLKQQPGLSGAEVIYQRLVTFPAVNLPAHMVGVALTNQPVAGTLQDFQLTVYNHGFAPMDVLLVRENGTAPGDIYVSVINSLGEEVSRGRFLGTLPGMHFTPGGRGYVTVTPGDSIEVTIEDVLIPSALVGGSGVRVEGGVSEIAYGTLSGRIQTSGPISGSMWIGLALSEYYGTAATDKHHYSDDETVEITGQALDRTTDTPITNADLRIGFSLNDYIWHEEVTTDTNGNYRLDYSVPAGIGGTIGIWAAHPEVIDRLQQAEVEVYRLFVLPQYGAIRMSKNDTFGFSLNIRNPGTESLAGFSSVVRVYRMDGTNEIDISSVTGRVTWAQDFAVSPGKTGSFGVRLQADMDAPDNAVIELRLTSAQGASGTFVGSIALLEAVPILTVTEPRAGYVEVGVNRGRAASRTVTIVNRGLRDLSGVTMLPTTEFPWMTPMLPARPDGRFALPDLPVGATKTFMVAFVPPAGTPMGNYSDYLTIQGTNHAANFYVNLHATVTSAEKGDVQFFVQNTLALPVPNATIRMRNRVLGTEVPSITTDTNGIAVALGLQEGRWSWQASAPGHSGTSGTIQIVPDQTQYVDTRLRKSLVTVVFRVEPVPFTDRYQIRIEQTFETHVPAPVLVVTPPLQQFHGVAPGFSATVVTKAKNYGLISLNDFTIEGGAGSWSSSTPLVTYLPYLDPFQEVDIPILVRVDGNPLAEDSGQGGRRGRQGQFSSCVGGVGGPGGAFGNLESNIDKILNRYRGDFQCKLALNPDTGRALIKFLLVLKDLTAGGASWGNVVSTGLKHLTPTGFSYDMTKGTAIAAAGCLGQDSGGNDERGPGKGDAGFASPKDNPPMRVDADGCFAPGTFILLADGSRVRVEHVMVGDVVRCGWRDGDVAKVCDTLTGTARRMVRIAFAAPDGSKSLEPLTVTGEHYVWIDGKGWTAANAVQVGDAVFTADQQRVRVSEVETLEGESTYISLRLREDIALFANDILVHDFCGVGGGIGAIEVRKAVR